MGILIRIQEYNKDTTMINAKDLLLDMQNLTLLFAEDHTELRVNTTEILKTFFKKVDSVPDGEEALKYYKDAHDNGEIYDLVLTDLQMPKMDAIALIEKIYEINPSQSIVVLSAHDDSFYLLPLINLGIEQFIKKPIDYQELLKSLSNVVKKQKKPTLQALQSNTIDFGNGYLYTRKTKILSHNKENIYLTKYEIIFLELITTQIGKIYSNEDIVNSFLTLDENIDSQNIRKLVSKLRKKLPAESLESIYGVGYRIVPFYL